MTENQFVASIHNDYLPFVEHATDEELAQFIRAQIRQSNGEEVPELAGMAKALFEAHTALVARLENSKKKKSEAGKLGGNPHLKQSEAVVKQCLNSDKAVVKPNTVTNTITITNNEDLEAKASCRENPTPDVVREIVEHLNEKAKTNYRPSGKATQRLINARLNEGYKLDDFIAVIDKKCAEWLNSDMAKFLRPETLFDTKFESYLNQPARASPKQSTQPRRNVFAEIEARERAKENPEVIPDDTC